MARIVDFFDGAQSETTPTIGNIVASSLAQYVSDAEFIANEQGAPVKGNIYFNTTINFIRYYTGTSWINLVDETSSQSINNKNINAELNTLSNISNDEIKNTAGIDAFKLVDGLVDNAEFNRLNGVTAPIQTQLDSKIPSAEKGAANGVAPLDGSAKIDPSYLPSYVDDVLEYANFAALPGTGETGKLYVTLDNNKVFRWTGSIYVEVSASVDQLNDISDVNTAGVQDGDVLTYDQGTGTWIAGPNGAGTIVQENIALVLGGQGQWIAGDAGPSPVAQSITNTNDFAIPTNIRTGFTFFTQKNGKLKTVQTKIVDRNLGNGNGVLRAYIYDADSGLPIGSALQQSANVVATSNFTAAPNVIIDVNFNFDGTLDLISGQEYAFVIESTDTGTLYSRRGNVNEPNTQNINETAADTDTYVASATQETMYFVVLLENILGTFLLTAPSYVSIPGLQDDYHTIQSQNIGITNDQAAYIELDRAANSSTDRTVFVDNIVDIVNDNNKLIFIRVKNDVAWFGLNDLIPFTSGQSLFLEKTLPTAFEQPTEQTNTYNISPLDKYLFGDASAGAFTFNLPTQDLITNRELIIQKTDTTTNNPVTITNGVFTTTLNTQGETVTLIYDSANWRIVNRHIPKTLTYFTPTFQGFGVPSPVNIAWSRDGKYLVMHGSFTPSAVTAVQARIGFPAGLTVDSNINTNQACGLFWSGWLGNAAVGHCIAFGGNSYITLGREESSIDWNVDRNADFLSTTAKNSFTFRVPIQEWNG